MILMCLNLALFFSLAIIENYPLMPPAGQWAAEQRGGGSGVCECGKLSKLSGFGMALVNKPRGAVSRQGDKEEAVILFHRREGRDLAGAVLCSSTG